MYRLSLSAMLAIPSKSGAQNHPVCLKFRVGAEQAKCRIAVNLHYVRILFHVHLYHAGLNATCEEPYGVAVVKFGLPRHCGKVRSRYLKLS